MGKRGPKGKSPELESAQGFPGRRKSRTKAALAAAAPEPAPHATDIQDELPDSRFVQPPPHLGKRERAVWAEIFSGPNARLWYKFSDHDVIARYCTLTVMWRQMSKVPPQPTYEVTRIRPVKDGAPAPLPEILIKRNPAFDAMLSLAKELRAIAHDVGLSPDSRLSLTKKGLEAGDSAQPTKPEQSAPQSGKPAGPVGLLKARTQVN